MSYPYFLISEDELDTLDNMDQNDFVRDLLERIRGRKRSGIVEELERLKQNHNVNCFDYGMSKEQHEDHGQYLAYNYAIEIIKNGVEK